MAEKMPEKQKWYHGKITVLLMLFLVLGPFGFPLLWKSPRFSRPWKWILTVLTTLYTIWIFLLFDQAVEISMKQLSQMGLG